ncbi:heterokaryon incompatibility protein-domain-containing protein [Hypoxylon sp. FL1284]|nr:heterokaryon incompatibility protein-domain-containing protein [Hypoxylon sp. FL1284]
MDNYLGSPLPYRYQPLPNDAHTRVLDLQPSIDPAGPLHGSLRFVNLDSDPFFDALSYTWGNLGWSEEIIVDGSSFLNITRNLRDALARFRHPTEVRHLWVDALCINQADAAEKARQIPLMSHIYRGASSVVVWLGGSQEGSTYMRRLALLTQRLSGAERAEDLERALDELALLPWFTRRWIIQEVARNPNIVLYCGTTTIPWLMVLRVPSRIRERGQTYKSHIDTFRRLWEFHVLSTGRQLGILDLLSAFSEAGCADARDRIYALAGLASDVTFGEADTTSGKIAIKVDYTKSTELVFKDFGTAVIARYKQPGYHVRYDLFDHTMNRADGSNLNGQCSWAPDWRLSVARRQLRFNTDMQSFGVRDARRETAKLHDAYFLGIVNAILDPFPRDPDPESIISWVKDTFGLLKRQISTEEHTTSFDSKQGNILWAQLLGIITAGEVKAQKPYQPIDVSEHLGKISSYMKGRALFTVSAVAYYGQEDPGWLQLGIGPSHTLPGDVLCSGQPHSEGFLIDIGYVSGWVWTPSLIFRETRISQNARAQPLRSCVWHESRAKAGKEDGGSRGNSKIGVAGLVALDWDKFEFDLVGEVYTNEYERIEEPGRKEVMSIPSNSSITPKRPTGLGRLKHLQVFHVKCMGIH